MFSRLSRGVKIFLALFMAVFAQGVLPTSMAYATTASQQVAVTTNDEADKITICHATSSIKNPYRSVTVSLKAVDGKGKKDHSSHEGPVFNATMKQGDAWGDIIPDTTVSGATFDEDYNWTESGQSIWNAGCVAVTAETVKAEKPTRDNPCGVENDTFTIPEVENVTYFVDGEEVVAGTHNYTAGTDLTVTAEADEGYRLVGKSEWVLKFSDVACKEPAVRADRPTHYNPCGVENDTFTIPEVENVTYFVDGEEVAAGTHNYTAGTDLTVTAEADEGYRLVGKSEWVLKFSDKRCPEEKITICHRTAAIDNPYRQITVNQSAADGIAGNSGNRADHYDEHDEPVFDSTMKQGDHWGDIIPPIEGVHEGLNWNEQGQAIWNNDCKPVDQEEPTPANVALSPIVCPTQDALGNQPVEVILTNSGETDGTATVNGVVVPVPAGETVTLEFTADDLGSTGGFIIVVIDGEEVERFDARKCFSGGGDGPFPPIVPKPTPKPVIPAAAPALPEALPVTGPADNSALYMIFAAVLAYGTTFFLQGRRSLS